MFVEYSSEKSICYKCIGDQFLKKYIKQNAHKRECSYCNNKSKKFIAIHLDHLKTLISDGLSQEWGDPNEEFFYDAAEDEWEGETFNTWSLASDIQEEAGIANAVLLRDILNLVDRGWCETFDLKLAESLYTSWNIFTDLVTHKYRYTFFAVEEKSYEYLAEDNILSPRKILHELGRIINSHKKLIINLPKHTEIFRGRIFNNKSDITHTAKALGTVPQENAIASRMSPTGIPLFYGALNEKTAIEEIGKDLNGKCLVIAKFKTLVDLKILNLCDLPTLPSLFDPKQRKRRETIKFLKKFTEEISRPIDHNRNKNIEYIPSQVMSEYFRHCFKDKNGDRLNGIFYPSSKHFTGTCCGLFIKNEHCIDKSSRNNRAILQLITSQMF